MTSTLDFSDFRTRHGAFVLLFALAIGVASVAVGQPVDAPAVERRAAETPPSYWIFLEARPASAPGPTSSPAADVRRTRRGALGASELTRPVAPSYLATLRSHGVVPHVRSRWLHAVSASLTPDAVSRVRALPFVRAVRPVGRGIVVRDVETAAPRLATGDAAAGASPLLWPPADGADPTENALASTDPDETVSYGPSAAQLSLMNALAPLQRGVNGRGVRLGFLDTRYRALAHPAFDALHRDGRVVAVRDFTQGDQTNNHGGAVVSVAAGYTPGTLVGPAHGAEILAAATEYTASETNVEEDDFVAGLEWLETNGVDVVNVSLGYTRFDAGERSYTVDDLDGDTGVTTRAVDAAARLGVTVVVSAGNSGCDAPTNCWYYLSTPADADSAITVGAVGPDSTRLAFSSRGPTADGRTKPDVVAQGRSVVAAWNASDFRRVDGTSFSSPLVAGVVAQMLQVNPDLTPIEVRTILRRTASHPHAPTNESGWGVVNADAAVRAAEVHSRENPPPALRVDPPYPNPASSRATLVVHAPAAESLRVELYDVLGRRAYASTRSLLAGPNRVSLPVARLSPGMYVYRIRTDSGIRTGTLTVVR